MVEQTIRLVGEIDIGDRYRLRRDVVDAQMAGTDRLIFDCSELTFCGSECVHLFVFAQTKGMAVVVRDACPVVRRVFEMAGLPAVDGITIE